MSFASKHVVNFNLCAFSEKAVNSLCEMPRPESCEGSGMMKTFWMVTFIITIK